MEMYELQKIIGRRITLRSNINVDIGNQVLDGLNNLLKDDTFSEFCLEHVEIVVLI